MNDWAPIIVAIIAAVGSVLGVVLTNSKSNRDFDAKLDKSQAVFEAHVTEQIESVKADVRRLEAKQDKHNGLIEKTYALEKAQELQAAEIKRHGERIKILEGGREWQSQVSQLIELCSEMALAAVGRRKRTR